MAQLEVARLNHHRNYKRMVSNNGESAGVSYDESRVDELTVKAQQLFEQGDYQQANDLLLNAQNAVQGAIQKMMDNQEIVYKLDIGTPEKEHIHDSICKAFTQIKYQSIHMLQYFIHKCLDCKNSVTYQPMSKSE